MKLKQQLVASTLFAMRITFAQVILTILFTCNLYAKEAKSQKVLQKSFTISVQNVPLQNLIFSIQKKTNVQFTFSANAINAERIITYSARDKKIIDFLNEVLKPYNIGYQVLDEKIILYPLNTALVATIKNEQEINARQQRTLSGTVTNDKGELLPALR